MRKLLVGSAVILGVALSAGPASAVPILPAGSNWEYTFSDPTGDPAWNTTGIWSAKPTFGDAPFGNTSGGDFGAATSWPVDGIVDRDDDLWVRRTFDTTGYVLSSILWNLGVDNGYKLYLNGTLINSANAEGFTVRWEYSGGFGGSLLSGVNVIAVALEDHGGLTAFDMEVVGDPVPEPGTLLLLGSGLTGLALRRRRRAC